jgi:hypothetical protein
MTRNTRKTRPLCSHLLCGAKTQIIHFFPFYQYISNHLTNLLGVLGDSHFQMNPKKRRHSPRRHTYILIIQRRHHEIIIS